MQVLSAKPLNLQRLPAINHEEHQGRDPWVRPLHQSTRGNGHVLLDYEARAESTAKSQEHLCRLKKRSFYLILRPKAHAWGPDCLGQARGIPSQCCADSERGQEQQPPKERMGDIHQGDPQSPQQKLRERGLPTLGEESS